MSFNLSGAADSNLWGTTVPAGTGSMTIVGWFKRTADFAGVGRLFSLRNAGELSGHELRTNRTGPPAYQMQIASNYSTPGDALSAETAPLNAWFYGAVIGNATALDLKTRKDTAYVTAIGTQTVITPTSIRWGSDGYGGMPFIGLIAYPRIFSGILTEAEIEAERLSTTPVHASCISSHTGVGADITAAMAAQVGAALTQDGGVTVSSDNPVLDAFVGTTISGEAYIADLSTPSQPVATVLNSDTLSLAVSGIDTLATDVEVWARITLPIAGDWQLLGTYPKAEFPKEFTDLQVAATYEFRVVATNQGAFSDFSPVSVAKKLHRLFIYGHVNTSAQGVAGCKYQVGPPLAADEVWPAGTFAKGEKAFDASLVTYSGNPAARLVVELTAQTTPKLRAGNPACMMITKVAEDKSTKMLTTTVQVIENV